MSDQKCLTLFDVTGIQEFVFGPNKAKENIGGSIYVQKIFEDKLIECIGNTENVVLDWEHQKELQILNNDAIKTEILYIGGGNAMVIFDSKTSAVDVTKKLSQILLKETQATLGVVVSHLETKLNDFMEDRKQLFKQLQEKKNQYVYSTPLRGISITEECGDGLPTQGKKDKDKKLVSNVTNMKNELIEGDKQFDNLLPDDYSFPKEFDDLGQKEGESHVAVVHIDGNSMGAFIDDKLDNIPNYSDAIPIIRDISKRIKHLYQNVFKELTYQCKKEIFDSDNEKLKNRFDKQLIVNKRIPLRPIILNGDDITFVCDGRIGIQLANNFLKILSGKELELDSNSEKLSACAGIAIVKSHFPFYRAYQLAEELCGSAKKKAKALNKENPGCWMDYHIVYSGFQLDLDAIRKEQYNVPGMNGVLRDVNNKYSQYNLLLRPFCVDGEADNYYQWEKMENLYFDLAIDYDGKKQKTFPRSRLKNLRNGYISSKEEVEQIIKQNASRDYILSDFSIRDGSKCSNSKPFLEYQTPYFEPLELLDFYIPEFKLEKEDK